MIKVEVNRLFNGIASVRDYRLKKAIQTGQDIELHCKDESMVIKNEEIQEKVFQINPTKYRSKFEPYNEYELLDFKWTADKQKDKLIDMFNGKEVDMDFDLSNYKPEKVKDQDFEVITGKGFICKVNSAKIEDVDAGSNDRGSYEGYTRFRYELEIISDKNKGRRLWKSYNLSSTEKTGKANKTPVEKLADAFFTIGLEFSNSSVLEIAIEKFAEMEFVVSCSKFKPKGGDIMQLHTMTAVAPERWDEQAPKQETAKEKVEF